MCVRFGQAAMARVASCCRDVVVKKWMCVCIVYVSV